jgi:copper chaperone CopZ
MGETEVEEKKFELKTAVYKVHVHCGQCARDIETQFTEFHGACPCFPVSVVPFSALYFLFA